MSRQRGVRLSSKALHKIAGMGYGGALAACLVINGLADRPLAAKFAAARQAFAAITQYVLMPSMVITVVSGLISLAATQSFLGASWAWAKAALRLIVFQATLLIGRSARRLAGIAAAGVAGPAVVDAVAAVGADHAVGVDRDQCGKCGVGGLEAKVDGERAVTDLDQNWAPGNGVLA